MNFTAILKAAEEKNPEALYRLSKIHPNQGMQKELFEKALKTGYPAALADNAINLFNETNTDAGYKKVFDDLQKALSAFESYGALTQELTESQGKVLYCIGKCYHEGYAVERDIGSAEEFYQKEILGNERDIAHSGLDEINYERGCIARENGDKDQAIRFYNAALGKNLSTDASHLAADALGDMYFSGELVDRDYKKAFFYYSKHTTENSIEKMSKILSTLSLKFAKEVKTQQGLGSSFNAVSTGEELLLMSKIIEELKNVLPTEAPSNFIFG